MSEMFASFLAPIFGGSAVIGLVVFGLSKWLGNIWAERLRMLEDARITIETLQAQATIDTEGREHQTELDQRLKNLEQEYEKITAKADYFHQVTLDTYQEIFKKKIEVYDELTKLKSIYINNFSIVTSLRNEENFPDKNYHDSANGIENYAKLLAMYEIVTDNQLYVSTALLKAFTVWTEESSKLHARHITETLPEITADSNMDEYIGESLKKRLIDLNGRSITELAEYIDNIFSQIDKDIEFIKNKHSF